MRQSICKEKYYAQILKVLLSSFENGFKVCFHSSSLSRASKGGKPKRSILPSIKKNVVSCYSSIQKVRSLRASLGKLELFQDLETENSQQITKWLQWIWGMRCKPQYPPWMLLSHVSYFRESLGFDWGESSENMLISHLQTKLGRSNEWPQKRSVAGPFIHPLRKLRFRQF